MQTRSALEKTNVLRALCPSLRVMAFVSLCWPAVASAEDPVASPGDAIPKEAIDVQGDLALLPSGYVHSLKPNSAFPSWGPFSQITGDSRNGCGVLRGGIGGCWDEKGARSPAPTLFESLGKLASIAGSLSEGCAARVNGTVVCWDHGTGKERTGPFRPIIGSGWDIDAPPKPPLRFTELPGLRDVVSVTGGRSGCALHRSGSVSCWGSRMSSKAPRGLFYEATPVRVSGLSHIRQVVQDGLIRCALTKDGRVYCWGRRFVIGTSTAAELEMPFDEGPRQVSGISAAVQISISTASESGCAALMSGRLMCWGAWDCNPRSDGRPRLVPNIKDVSKVLLVFPSICIAHPSAGLSCWHPCREVDLGIPPLGQ